MNTREVKAKTSLLIGGQLPPLFRLICNQFERTYGNGNSFHLFESLLLAQALAMGELRELSHSQPEMMEHFHLMALEGRLCFRLSELQVLSRTFLTFEKSPGFVSLRDAMQDSSQDLEMAWFWHLESGEPCLMLSRMGHLQLGLYRAIQQRSLPPQEPFRLSAKPGSALPEDLLRQCIDKLDRHRLLLISGGPGSGKTTLLAKLLRLLQGQAVEVALSAPTARAAQRILESVHAVFPESTPSMANVKAHTIHKLLGRGWSSAELYRPAQSPFQEDGRNYHSTRKLLPLDLLVVDEASMLDSELALQLFSSLHYRTRLILIGDPEQLPAIGVGSFWQDAIAVAQEGCNPDISDCLLQLQGSHRSVPEIQTLAQRVLEQQPLELEKYRSTGSSIRYVDWDASLLPYLRQYWCPPPSPGFAGLRRQNGELRQETLCMLAEQFSWLKRASILNPLQNGRLGARYLNQSLVQDAVAQGCLALGRFYCGCPIQVTRNNYALGLYNGDRGFCLRFGGQAYAVFDGGGEDNTWGGYRFIPIGQLGDCEASFLQTIHKSQGSEYDRVCILLPENKRPQEKQNIPYSPWSKALLYTAITRAKQELCFVGSQSAVQELQQNLGKAVKPLSLLQTLFRNNAYTE